MSKFAGCRRYAGIKGLSGMLIMTHYGVQTRMQRCQSSVNTFQIDEGWGVKKWGRVGVRPWYFDSPLLF